MSKWKKWFDSLSEDKREEQRIKRRNWYHKTKEQRCSYQKEYRKKGDFEFYRTIKRKYGLTKEMYADLLKISNNSCMICEKECKLVVDHCHTTGKVRGLLCHRCNSVLGHIENQELMAATRKYLGEPT